MVVRWSLTVGYNGRRQNVRKDVMFFLLPPATKLGQGYIFTGVCDSVHRGGCLLPGICSQGGAWSRGVSAPEGCLVWGVSVPRGSGPGRCLVETPLLGRLLLWRYASYWDAFLLSVVLTYRVTFVNMNNRIDRK